MGEYDPTVWGLGNKSESLFDAPKQGWGESMLSRRREKPVSPVQDLADFLKEEKNKADAENANNKKIAAPRDEQIKFTEPVKIEAGMPPILKGKMPRNEPQGGDNNTPDTHHDWKIISAAVDPDEPTLWTVATGTVVDFNGGTTVTVGSTSVEGEIGSIYLHITRNPSTRLVTTRTVEFYTESPLTTESDQFIELGAVGGDPLIIQKQFTPVRIYEDLFVINGEFRLGNLAMFADNLYTPPT